MMKIIKNGILVTSSKAFKADLLIENEKIKSIGINFDENGCDIIDATDCYVFPAAIDVHTHFDLDVGNNIRSVDDFSSGSIAAACGGVCTIVDHMAFGPKDCSLTHQPKVYHKLADNKTFIDYSFHGTIQHVNDDVLSQMEDLVNEGISSFKLYTTYGYKLSESDILSVLHRARELKATIAVHCEDDDMVSYAKNLLLKENKIEPKFHPISRPGICEEAAVQNLISLSKLVANSRLYVVHLSTKGGLDALKAERIAQNKNIFVETCSQYLVFDDSCYEKDEALKYTMSPPLRKKEDIEALWAGVRDGFVDIIATDHCPFNLGKEKQRGRDNFLKCPGGAPGVEERFRVVFTEGVAKKRISLTKFVEVMCENPAKIYGIENKGALIPGYDADIVIYDPREKQILKHSELHGKVDYSLYDGFEVFGCIKKVFLRGEKIVENNKFLDTKPRGKFIHRQIAK